jgi:putative flavoprotein involved in K+ transport
LSKRGKPFVILDAFDRVGDAWRKRWDSLRLFTPARYDGLPGFPYPAPPSYFPTKDEFGDYMETYAKRFSLEVRNGVKADDLTWDGNRYVVTANGERYEADNVVVATGANRIPKTPAFASELGREVVQMHSSEYLNPGQLREGDVLVVGVGNSGAEIAKELSQTGRRVYLSGKESGQIPVRHGSTGAKLVFPVVRFMGHHVLTLRNPIGRRAIAKMRTKADPLIRVRRPDLDAAGVVSVGRVTGVAGGLPLVDDGSTVDVTNVIWCTGYRNDFGWIDLPVFNDDGLPKHDRGIVDTAPGLYFVGLSFQFSASSEVLPSRGRDARYVAAHVASRRGAGRTPEPAVRSAV